MLTELKSEIQKTFNRKIENRGACEALVQDIYEKTGAVISYNTVRRLYGLAEYRKPRESTLDHLAVYCGFRSFKDFSQRYTEVDIWPTWENLYVSLSKVEIKELITLLQYKKQRNEQFSISFVIVIRELLYRKDENSLVRLFQEPAFQFANLPYDEVAQIGVLIGLHFRNSPHSKLELRLLELPNFRDLVFKIFVDYGRLHQKYGVWLRHLLKLRGLDNETMVFIRCIEIWRLMLSKQAVPQALLKTIPLPSKEQHPILIWSHFWHSATLYKKPQKKRNAVQLNAATYTRATPLCH